MLNTRSGAARGRAWRILASALALVACKKAPPPPAASSAPNSQATAGATALVSSAPLASSKPLPSTPPPAKPPEPKPTLLDAEGQRVAKAYLAALAKGRKATLAKDYALAEEQFSRCLELLPHDPRALSERGYARLLADKPSEAREDLLAARDKAPNAALAQQIVHNLMLAARKSGDEAKALEWEAEKKRLKASRRLPGDVDCSLDVSTEQLEPTEVSSIEAALQAVAKAHAQTDSSDVANVTFVSPVDDERYQADLIALKAQNPVADGSVVLWTSASSGYQNHALIARAGKLYVYPSLSTGYVPLCGFENLAEVSIDGGGATPLRIQRSYRDLARVYLCQQADGTFGPDCGDDAQTMGSCNWSHSRVEVSILDAKTFRSVRLISASVGPASEKPATEPERLLDLEWQADHVMVEACGRRQKVPYGEP